MWELAAVVLFATVAAPLAKVCVITTVLLGRTSSTRRTGYADCSPGRASAALVDDRGLLARRVRGVSCGWAPVHIELGAALYALAALMLSWWPPTYTLDAEAVWDVIGSPPFAGARRSVSARIAAAPRRMGCGTCRYVTRTVPGTLCPRCGFRCRHASRTAIARTWALGFAALILYIPANTYPVLTLTSLGAGHAQHHPGRRARAAGGRHVAARGAGVLRQHRWCRWLKVIGLTILLVIDADRVPPAAARPHPAVPHHRQHRPLVDDRHLHGLHPGGAAAVRR